MSRYTRSAIQSDNHKQKKKQLNSNAILIIKHFFNNNAKNKKQFGFSNLKQNTRVINRKYSIFRQILQSMNRKRNLYLKYGFGKIYAQSINSLSAQLASQSQNTNNQEEEYKKLEIQLESLTKQNQSIIYQYKFEIGQLDKKNESLKFNFEYLESNNQQLQKQIFQAKQKTRKKVSMTQIWEQIYRNFVHFLIKNQNKKFNKEDILQNLQIPFVNINAQNATQENKVLEQLLNQYINAGMASNNIDQIGLNTQNGRIQLSSLPYDIISKTNKYFYDVVATLIQRGLGKIEDIDTLKIELQTLAQKVKP